MPTPFASQLIEQYSTVKDYKFSAAIQVKTATSLGTEFGKVMRFEPWENKTAKPLLAAHPVAIWNVLEVRLAPRAGVYGRMCSFYGGWGAANMKTPTTVEEMVALNGAIDVTYGGTGDPGTVRMSIPCNFDNTMQDILKAPYGDGGRPVFFYCFTEADVVDKPADADRFMLTFKGSYILEVAATESNHGEIVETPEKHSLSNSFNRLGTGASQSPIAKQKQKRFAISDLGFVDSGEDYPRTLELAGCSLASEMFIIFPGYQLWRSLDEDNEMLFQLFKDTDLLKPVAMVWVMYQSGLVKDDRIVKTVDHFIFFPGTYLFHADPESGEFSAEFNLLV